jgi:hypothetical protein
VQHKKINAIHDLPPSPPPPHFYHQYRYQQQQEQQRTVGVRDVATFFHPLSWGRSTNDSSTFTHVDTRAPGPGRSHEGEEVFEEGAQWGHQQLISISNYIACWVEHGKRKQQWQCADCDNKSSMCVSLICFVCRPTTTLDSVAQLVATIHTPASSR